MFKIYLMSLFILLTISQSVFANLDGRNSCKHLAHSCRAAGFDKSNKFWSNCMKPVLMGKTIKGVSIDKKVADACRANKIEKMKKEINELESVK